MKTLKSIIAVVLLLVIAVSAQAQQKYYFPDSGSFDPKIPTPEEFLGYPIGSHYTCHDQIVAYFNELARLTDKIHVQLIGKTYELRPQIIATITSPDNYKRLEQIRQEHLTLTDPAQPLIGNSAPVVVLLGYSVHGAETSSGEASLLTAYYLAANQSEETQKWLKDAVVFIDPSLNPDGRDRAANWHNGYKSFPPVADPVDKEHNQEWPGGRVNHFFTDLNRDWLSAEQVETQNRLKFFHQWYPNVQIDFHEMGTNSTYYFEPSPEKNQSPIVPKASYDFNATLAKYHAQALDKIGSLYFTKEAFDNLSPIYGSTYPDFYGAVGVTFEQGSSRGLVQESETGLVKFSFTVRNHLVTGLATVRGAVAEKENLFKLQKSFFQSALDQAKTNQAKAYVFGDSRDVTLTRKLLALSLEHHLKVYDLAGDLTIDGKRFEKGKAYIVPASQPNFRIVHSVFDETAPLKDSTYYDNTSWSVAHAYGLQFAKITAPNFSLGAQINALPEYSGEIEGNKADYAYLLNWSDYNASKALYYLLSKGVVVKSAHLPFTVKTSNGKQDFGYGSLVVPVAVQTISSDSLYRAVKGAADLAQVKFATTNTGFSIQGIDLGSNNIKAVKKPEVALFTGGGLSVGEVGQVWFLLNNQLNLPVTKLDIENLGRTSLDRYNTLILTSGIYSSLRKEDVQKLKSWVGAGGTLITFKSGAEWAIKEDLVKEKIYVDSASVKKSVAARVDFSLKDETETAKRINGGIFLADIDITNPVAFGLNNRKIYFTKNGNTILLPSKDKYSTVAKYLPAPYVSGYVSKPNIAKISNTASVLISQFGRGNVVLFAEDPTYRHYWHGTDRLLINSIFFANQISGTRLGQANANE
jgi:hypothetical protein